MMLDRLARLVSTLVGFGVGFALYSRLGAWLMGGRDDRGILVLLVALPVAVLAGTGYAVLAEESWGRRALVVHGAGLVFFWWGFVAPLQRESKMAEQRAGAEARREQTRVARAAATPPAAAASPMRDLSKEARAAFLRELRRTGAHGATGVVPPMLGVSQDRQARITITNKGDTAVYVALARVKEIPGDPPRWRGCDMDPLVRGQTYAFLKPGWTWFYDPGPRCPPDLREATLEYRVGGSPGDTGWWSDSAFEAPEGRPPDAIE